MAVSYLLDSNILIDYLNEVPKAVRWLQSMNRNQITISPITRAEVLAGVDYDETIMQWLDSYRCVLVDDVTADVAAELRRTWKYKLPDALQAAACLQHDLTLVTRDAESFKKVSHFKIEIPYALI